MADEKTKKGTVWVLDTQTKGTGANMVPLDRTTAKPGANRVPDFVLPERRPPDQTPAPPAPRRFRVLDVMTNQVVVDNADVRTTVEALEDFHSIVDVIVFLWDYERERWRTLTFDDSRVLWALRGSAPRAPASEEP